MSHKPEGSSAPSPYAALSASHGAPACEQAQGQDTLASMLQKSATPPHLIQEALKLEALKDALWAAFKATPENNIPTPLLDLASIYTSALRLQLSLISHAPAKSQPKVEPGRLLPRGKPDRSKNTL
jgi:hypothetical protein